MATPAKNVKICPEINCPIDPEFWQRIGRIAQSLEDGDSRFGRMESRMERMENKIDDLNHIKKRGAQFGAASGTAAGVVSAGILVWLKSKLG